MTETIVLVGCGSAKLDEPAPARDLYTSNYFASKRRYAELAGDSWAILSAEHALLEPDRVVPPYDTELGDDDVDVEEWAQRVLVSLKAAAPTWERLEVQLLAGRDYCDPVRPIMPDEWEVRRPWDDLDGGGLPAQQRWLSEQIDARIVDAESGETRADGGKTAQTLQCRRCNRPTWHDVVDAESVDGTAWQCSECMILRESAQTTVDAAARGGEARGN